MDNNYENELRYYACQELKIIYNKEQYYKYLDDNIQNKIGNYIFQKFQNYKFAEMYINNIHFKTQDKHIDFTNNRYSIFTDGSYKNGIYSWSYIVLKNGYIHY